jgi:hypothetical protein
MANWVLMNWVSETARPHSIFGILDRDQLSEIPPLEEEGRWEEMRDLEPKLAPDAERASQATTRSGYYLIGGADTYVTK